MIFGLEIPPAFFWGAGYILHTFGFWWLTYAITVGGYQRLIEVAISSLCIGMAFKIITPRTTWLMIIGIACGWIVGFLLGIVFENSLISIINEWSNLLIGLASAAILSIQVACGAGMSELLIQRSSGHISRSQIARVVGGWMLGALSSRLLWELYIWRGSNIGHLDYRLIYCPVICAIGLYVQRPTKKLGARICHLSLKQALRFLSYALLVMAGVSILLFDPFLWFLKPRSGFNARKMDEIRVGMTQEDVFGLCGPVQFVYGKTEEKWYYSNYDPYVWFHRYRRHYAVIFDENKRVLRIEK